MDITLYTKPGCHLCDHLKDDLAALRREIPFSVVERNIEADPVDFDRFRYLIPVLAVGETLLYPPHDLLQVRRALLDAAGRSTVR